MKIRTYSKVVFVMAMLFIIAGCVTPKPAGFLREYSKMEPIAGIKYAYGYKNPAANFEGYQKFIIEPVYVYDSYKKDMPWINPNARDELGQYFQQQLIEQFGQKYTITDNSGEGVLIFRSAITHVTRNVPLLNIWPGTVIGGSGLGTVTIEAELIDSVTGQRVAAIIVKGKGKRLKYHKGFTYWAHNKDILAHFAKALRQRFDAMSGR